VNDDRTAGEASHSAYTPLVGEALRFAADAHASQTRKGKKEPYLSHLLMVASLVIHYGGDEDQIIAGVLHDTVEDQGGQHMATVIRTKFGHRVADIVLDCSDATPEAGAPKPPWLQRKRAYVDSIRRPNHNGARLVEACDKLANLRDIVEDVQSDGDEVFTRFTGGKKGTLEYYATLGEVLLPQVQEAPGLKDEYDRLLEQLLSLTGTRDVRIWQESDSAVGPGG
jgi:(p)ppGpp synthase/HD superfamily hydrolase